MKAKRLTALALAALMAVSSATVALADPTNSIKMDRNKDGALRFYDTVSYYKYDDDEGTLVKVNRDAFKPGDTIYIPLYETSDKLSSNETFRVFEDIDIGRSWVDDVQFEYRRGDVVTTPGTTTTKYYLQGLTGSLEQYNGTEITVNSGESLTDAAKRFLSDKIQDAAAAEVQKSGSKWKKGWYVVSGDSTQYATEPEAIDAALKGVDEVDHYYKVDGQDVKKLTGSQTEGQSGDYIFTKADGTKQYIDKEKIADEANILSLSGFTKYDGTPALYGTITDISSGVDLTSNASGGASQIPTNANLFIKASTDGSGNYSFVNMDVAQTVDSLKKVGIKVEAASESTFYDLQTGAILNIVKVQNNGYFEGATLLGTDRTSVAQQKGYKGYTEVYTDGVNVGVDYKIAVNAAKNEILQGITDSNVKKDTVTTGPITEYRLTYWVRIDTEKSANTKENDVVGRIYVTPKSSLNSAKKDDSGLTDYIDIDVNLTNRDVGNDDFEDVDSDAYIEPGQRAVLSFADDADDVVIEFGDDAWYEFNARGQGRVNFAYNTNFDRDFAYDYDHANIDFINFVAEPTTNKTGTLYIYADEDSYIYEVTSKGAKKINGAYYDDDEGAWVIRTRHLTSYAISDRRLKTIDQMEDDKNSSSSSKPSGSQGSGSGNGNYKPIPDTGR